MNKSTVGPDGAFRCSSFTRVAPWIGLIALALPSNTLAGVPDPMDRQVTEIVNRAKPSVVSIRAGAREKIQSALPFWDGDEPGAPFFDADPPFEMLPAAMVGDQGCGTAVTKTRIRRDRSTSFKYPMSMFLSSRIGTGFCVDRDGTILTTTNVVGDSGQVQVKLADGRELSGKVLGADPPTGVAVVRLSGADLPALRLAAQDRPEAGQWAVIVGNQLDRDHSVWVGTVARTDVELSPRAPLIAVIPALAGPKNTVPHLSQPVLAPAARLLQIDAPVGAGASGAPVLNSKGDVVGIVVATSGPPAPALAIGFEQDEPKVDRDEEHARRDKVKARRDEERARRDEERARQLKDRLGKQNPEWQAQVQRVAAEAQRIGERAAEHAKALSARIEERAKRIAAEATEQSKALQERAAEEARRDAEDKSKSDADRQRLQEERARRLSEELKPLMEDLQRKLDRDLKPLEEELRRQLEQDMKPLQEQLKKLNDLLPMVQGLRELSIDLAPQISQAITQAHESARAAVAEAMKASAAAVPAAPPAPAPVPAAPSPAPAPEPEAPPAPGAQPAVFVIPTPAAAPGPAPMPAAATPPEPPEVSVWAGQSPEGGASTFAIPAATVGWVVSQIRERGHVSHPFLGVRLETLKPEERERLKAPEETRVRVGTVWPDSPAHEAGLKPGDLILQFEGNKVDGPADLSERLARTKAGDRVALEIWRDGKRETIHVTPREMTFAQPFFRGPAFAMPPGQPLFRGPVFTMPPGQPFFRGPITMKPDPAFTWKGKMDGLTGPMPRTMLLVPSGHAHVSASGEGREARVTLEAQDAELQSVLRELSRATGLQFNAEGEAARQHVTLKVERVPVDDLVESMERLFHLRSDRQGDRITFRAR